MNKNKTQKKAEQTISNWDIMCNSAWKSKARQQVGYGL